MDFNTQQTPNGSAYEFIWPNYQETFTYPISTGLENYNKFVLTKCENGFTIEYRGKQYVAENLSTIITVIRNLTEEQNDV